MAKAKEGDKVQVHYKGTLDNNEVFDSSEGKDPLEFTIGEKQVIPGFEDAVIGLEEGDEKKINIKSKDAYGDYNDQLKLTVEKSKLPPDLKLEEGQNLQIPQPDGNAAIVTVAEINDENVVLDANHPMAGKDLNFDIKLVKINC